MFLGGGFSVMNVLFYNENTGEYLIKSYPPFQKLTEKERKSVENMIIIEDVRSYDLENKLLCPKCKVMTLIKSGWVLWD